MKMLVQRVTRATVEIDHKIVGQIADGLLVLLGVGQGDTKKDADYLIQKILGLRIFSDDNGKMNKSVEDIGGGILVVSQFTLYGDCKKGSRPSFTDAAAPDVARELYDYTVRQLIDTGMHVETGEFGAYMQVESVNDGPVTLIIESKQ